MAFVIEHDFEVRAPAEVVWEVITDLPRYREWNPFCVECESTLAPGDPIRMQVNLTGKPQPVEEVMQAHRPGTHLAYHMKPYPLGALSSLRTHDVERCGDGASRYRSHFELRGWLAPVVRGLLGASLQRGFTGMSEGIVRRAEVLWSQRRR